MKANITEPVVPPATTGRNQTPYSVMETEARTRPPEEPDLADALTDSGEASDLDGEHEPIVAPIESGINIAGDTVTKATNHLPEDQKGLIRWLHAHARARRWTWRQLAETVDISSSTLSRIWNKRYNDPRTKQPLSLEPICKKIAALRAKVERPDVGEMPFLETETFGFIEKLVLKCHQRHRMGVLVGKSQRGKSRDLRELVRRHTGEFFLVEIPPIGGTEFTLHETSKALLVPPAKVQIKALDRLVEALDPSKTLIVDEWHRIFESSFAKGHAKRIINTFRYIYEKSGCGLLYSATDAIEDELFGMGAFRSFMEQTRRRAVGCVLTLSDFPPQRDLDVFIEHFKLERPTGEAEQLLLDIAMRDDIRGVSETLTDAAEIAARDNAALSWSHFVRAAKLARALAGPVACGDKK